MHYEGNVIRPPSEAFSIILQVTVGCSHNKCTFCGAYREVSFHLKDQRTIEEDICFASVHCRSQKTLFLADGNVLVLGFQKLAHFLTAIRHSLPWVRRVSCYGNCRDILHLSLQELQKLKKLGLGRIYMGLESGDNRVLAKVKKGSDSEAMIQAAKRVKESGIFLSVTSLLGIGGKQYSREHAAQTGRVLSAMHPNQIAILTLMLLENTPLYKDAQNGEFAIPGQEALFTELRTILENMDDIRCQFQANHASNYFSLDGRLPRDKDKFLATIDQALQHALPLKAESFRAL